MTNKAANGILEIQNYFLNLVMYATPEIGKDGRSGGPRWCAMRAERAALIVWQRSRLLRFKRQLPLRFSSCGDPR